MERMIEDEVAASVAFADWKMLTENEEVALAADRSKEVQASPMRGNRGQNSTRGNRKVKVRETGRFRRGNQ